MGSLLTIATAATPTLEWWPLAVNCFRSFLEFDYPSKNPLLYKIKNYSRPAQWYKIKIILDQPDGWFLWIDSDAKIVNKEYNIDSIKRDGKYLYLSSDQNGLNSGVMLIKINDATREFFQKVYSMVDFINSEYQEQSAITSLVRSNWNGCRQWIKVVEASQFNCYANIDEYHVDAEYSSIYEPFIIHHPGKSVHERQSRLVGGNILTRNEISKIGPFQIGVEIGVQLGLYSYNILHICTNKLYIVDPWEHIRGYIDSANLSYIQKENEYKIVYEIFKDTTVEILRMKSLEASEKFPDNFFDYVYIDADHSLSAVSQDMEAWWPKVKPGGYLCGHDYLNQKTYNTLIEVKEAVDKFVDSHNISDGFVTSEEYPSWFIKK